MDAYLNVVRQVLERGTRKENRTGIDTLSTFNINYTVDLSQGFPLLTTKEISWKNIVVENLWFLSGQTHIRLLQKHGCKFWDPWADARGEVEIVNYSVAQDCGTAINPMLVEGQLHGGVAQGIGQGWCEARRLG